VLHALAQLALAAQLAQIAQLATLPQAPATGTNAPPRGPPPTADASAARARALPTRQDADQPARPTRRVLLLFEETTQHPAVALVEQIVRQRLNADSSLRVELFEEHLRVTDIGGASASQLTSEYLRQKYADRRPDLVIGAGLPHTMVEKLSTGDLVGDVPVVLLSSDLAELTTALGSGRVTGVAVRADATATLEAALRLQPETRHVLVVIGTTDFERGIEHSVREQLRSYEERLRIEYTSEMSFPEVLRRAEALGRGSVVLFVSMLRDGAGDRFVTVLALEQLAEAASVPTYGVSATHLGRGIVGGALLDFAVLGERTADMARAVLAGIPASTLAIDSRASISYGFDWRPLQRFGLDPARLPPGSRVSYRIASSWERYRLPLLLLLGVCVAETILIVALLRQFRQRRAAEQARETHRQLERLLLRLSAKLVAATAAQLDTVAEEILAQASEFVGVDRAMLAMLDESATSLRVLHSWSAPGVSGTVHRMGPTGLPATWERLYSGRAVQIRSLSSLPDDLAADRHRYVELGVRSFVGLPMMADGRCLGVLAVAAMQHERSWDPGLVDGLNLLGLVLTSSIIRRRAELEVTQRREELSHLARVGIVGELSASLAHEINQPLGAILLSVQAVQRWLASGRSEPQEIARLLEQVSNDVRRAYTIIDRLRRLLRKEPTDLTEIRLDELVASIVALLHGDALRRRVTLTHSASDRVPPVQGDRVQIEQVVMNLVLNAFDSLVATRAPRRHVHVSVEGEPGGSVVVAVADSGDGIAPDRLELIFEPFVTSKRNGIGMGLAICRMIVESHGGRIWAENLPDGAHAARRAFRRAHSPLRRRPLSSRPVTTCAFD
jgi:C4-dicarboxylate-specific signal transduction histidine kinase